VVALCAMLVLAGPAFAASFAAAVGGLSGVPGAMADGGVFMYGLLFIETLGLVACCVMGYFYVVGRRLPGALLLLVPAAALGLGLYASWHNLLDLSSAIGFSDPSTILPLCQMGVAGSRYAVVLGALVGASLLGLAAVLATARALAWRHGGPAPTAGWVVLGLGLLLPPGAAAATISLRALEPPLLVIVLASACACLGLGLAAVSPTRTWRDGASRVTLAVSSLASVGLVALATKQAAFVSWLGVGQGASSIDRVTRIARGISQERLLEGAGWTALAVVAVVALGTLLVAGRQVLAAIRRGANIAVAVVAALVVSGLALLALAVEREGEELLDRCDRGDASFFARRNPDLLPATSPAPAAVGELVPTIVVDRDRIWLDDRRVADSSGFTASGDDGRRLRVELGDAVAAAERSRMATPERYGLQSALRARLDVPDPDAAPREPWRLDAVTLALHRDARAGTVRELAALLREMGFDRVDLLVSRSPPPRMGEEVRLLPAGLRVAPGDFGTLALAIGPGPCSSQGPGMEPGTPRALLPLALALEITPAGVVISGSGAVLGPECGTAEDADGPTVPPGRYEALRRCLERIKTQYPDEVEIIVAADATIDVQTLVRTLDAARGSTAPGQLPSLFPRPFLFVGDDLRATCHGVRPAPTFPNDEGTLGAMSGRSVPESEVVLEMPVSRGNLSPAVIREHVVTRTNMIRFCHEQQLAQHPGIAGLVTIRFVIDSSGEVTESGVQSSTLGNDEVERCVARAVQRIPFPQPEGGGNVVVTFPFVFRYAGGPPRE
jgi:TonB family protein